MHAEFLASATDLSHCPKLPEGEVAFLGRSNVGKSSLLGALMSQPSLVRVSRTPGRTQNLLFFRHESGTVLVDMPGYGYAKVSARIKEQMQLLIESYLLKREHLRAVFLLLDIRREGISPDDFDCFSFARAHGRHVRVILTKADRIAKTKRSAIAVKVARDLRLDPKDVLICSTHEHLGLKEIWSAIRAVHALPVLPPQKALNDEDEAP